MYIMSNHDGKLSLTENENSEAVEQGADVGQDPHQHSKLQRKIYRNQSLILKA